MAIDESMLVPEFRDKLHTLLAACRTKGVEVRPYFGIRTPFEQAKFWRQSRTREEIEQKIAQLKNAGAQFLAHCIESVGPQNGKPVTNAIPGLSWHQWGEAVDSVWIVDGKSEWSALKKVGGINGYPGVVRHKGRLYRWFLWRPHADERAASFAIYGLVLSNRAMLQSAMDKSFAIMTEYIKLDSFLKGVNAVGSGGEAKLVIGDGLVKVNNEVELRRGRKLYPGDRVLLAGHEFRVERAQMI